MGMRILDINSPVETLKGVGPKAKEGLNKCGIFTVLDLLLYFPRDYENININNSDNVALNSKTIIKCVAKEIKRDNRSKTGKLVTTIVFSHNEGLLYGKWFNQPYIKNNFKIGETYNIIGTIKNYKGDNIISNPKVIKVDNNEENKIIPKYSLNKSMTASLIGKLIIQILNTIEIRENLPMYIIEKYKLCSLHEAVRNIHYPTNSNMLTEATRRLKFQELFTYSMKLFLLKEYVSLNKEGISFSMCPELKELKEALPYNLTTAQSRVIREILIDEKKSNPMNRLVQGDVGSGKTIVAIIAMFNVVKNGYQAVLMAPTEILANQHYLEVMKVLETFNISIKLLTGSISVKEKKNIKEELKNGNIDIIIGTHALIEDNVEFNNLGMVVTDEQHRFGVHQRAKIYNKNVKADVLVMTATPIPRTLALYLYGDLDISIIDELPPGRKPIKTTFIEEDKKDDAYRLVKSEVEKGRQVYIVCPLVEENDELSLNSVVKLYEDLKRTHFKDIEIDILHGKMPQKDKDDIMKRFKLGDIKILVATTVIEVGVNVPNASIMIVENAERFGLSQLHQLRGRVGRGSYESYCILIGNAKNSVTKKRMNTMVESNDGFYIAEQDLKLRGSGEMFGLKQSGENELVISDIIEDINIFKVANDEAKKLIMSKNPKDIKVKEEIIDKLQLTSRYICFN